MKIIAEAEKNANSSKVETVVDNTKDTSKDNVYQVIGQTIYIGVRDINTINLYQNKTEEQNLMISVNSKEDFEAIKKQALSSGKIDFIQFDGVVYSKETNFEEAEEWKGFAIEESKD